MRAKDLKTDGTVYYYTTSDAWLKWTHQADRVIILDATPGTWRWEAREDKWIRRPGGQDVLVEIPAQGGNGARRKAIRTQAIRGTWDDCTAQLTKVRQAKQTAERERTKLMASIEGPCADAVLALRELGITAVDMDSNRHSAYAEVSVGFRSAPALLAAAQHLLAIGWKWEPPTE